MSPLILCPGPALLRPLDSGQGAAREDVSARAIEFLYDPLELDADLKLSDIFGLFKACSALIGAYRRFYAAELCAHAALGPLDSEEGSGLQFLELYRYWKFNSHSEEYSNVQVLELSAVSRASQDDPDQGQPDDDGLVRSCLDGADLRRLLNLPLRFTRQVKVEEADKYSTRYWQHIRTVSCAELSLGELLQTVVWSLSWFGSPEETEEMLETFDAMSSDPEVWEEMSFEELMEEQFGDDIRRGCDALFKSFGGHLPIDISSAICEIPDQTRAEKWLKEHLGKDVNIKKAYRKLGGRDFRQAFTEAQVENE